MPRHTIAGQMLESTADLVDGDRNKTHGTKLKNFQNIAAIWSAYLTNVGGKPVTASQCADMMELLKVARRQHGSHNPDDYVDGAGYAAVALEVKEGEIDQSDVAAKTKAADIMRVEKALEQMDKELNMETFGALDAQEMAEKLAPPKT